MAVARYGWLLLLLATTLAGAGVGQLPQDRLFGSDRVIPVQITIASEGLASLQKEPRTNVAATIRVDGQLFERAEVHLKGHGSFRPITGKPNFAVRLDRGFAGLQAFGHRRLLLNNSVQDPAYVRWKLASELFVKAGLAAPRLNFAEVSLNGRKLGVYVLLEPTDKVFLRQNFGAAVGNLYEGSNQDVEDKLELDSGDDTNDQSDLQALANACRETNLVQRWKKLRATLDVDKFASFMAMEVLVCHHDGYSLDRNNFRIYNNPQTQRMVFIPHGMDLIFDRSNLSLNGEWRGTVARAFAETPEGKRLYQQRAAELARMVYGTDRLNKRISELANWLRPHFVQGSQEGKNFESAVAALEQTIQRRRDFLLGGGK